MRRDVFQAVSDPTRRGIIKITSSKALTLNQVAESFNISRQAISKHIKILTECGLIVVRRDGRERYCSAQLQPLKEVSDWVAQYQNHWKKRLDLLESYLNKLQHKQKNKRK
jgi:DNA-binding transcriptional ArsR family regulator